MAPCPYSKRGEHCIAAITPGEDSGDLTFFCSACGQTRRMPASGSMLAGTPLDDWPAELIERVSRVGADQTKGQ